MVVGFQKLDQIKIGIKRERSRKMNRRKTTSPIVFIKNGLYAYKCRICKQVFKSLMPLSEHTAAEHQLEMVVKHYRSDDDDDVDDVDDNDDDDEDEESVSESDSDRYEQVDESDDDHVVKDGEGAWITDDRVIEAARSFAEPALEYLNNKDGGKKYELVLPGPYVASTQDFRHINFQAKEKDCLDAPVETFFAQIGYGFGQEKRVDCCVSLGPSNQLPHWRQAILGGCKECPHLVHHPLEVVDNLRLK